jgi:hypothetical protein
MKKKRSKKKWAMKSKKIKITMKVKNLKSQQLPLRKFPLLKNLKPNNLNKPLRKELQLMKMNTLMMMKCWTLQNNVSLELPKKSLKEATLYKVYIMILSKLP